MKFFGPCPKCGESRTGQNTLLINVDSDFDWRKCRCGHAFTCPKLLAPDNIRAHDYETYICEVCPDDLRDSDRHRLGLPGDYDKDLTATGRYFVVAQCPDSYKIEVLDLMIMHGTHYEITLNRAGLDTEHIEDALDENFNFSEWKKDQEDSILEKKFESIKESL